LRTVVSWYVGTIQHSLLVAFYVAATVQLLWKPAATAATQLFLARWWMTRFRFGPVEWLWRSLTDLRAQPMRQGPDRAIATS
jgi:uncharacterized membrane protein YeiB